MGYDEYIKVHYVDWDFIEYALRTRWENRNFSAFADLYTDAVSIWGDLDGKPIDGVYLCMHDAENYENHYVVVELAPIRVIIDPSEAHDVFIEVPVGSMRAKVSAGAFLSAPDTLSLLLDRLIDALHRIYAQWKSREEVLGQ